MNFCGIPGKESVSPGKQGLLLQWIKLVEIILRPRKGGPVIKPRIKPLDILMRSFFPSRSFFSFFHTACDAIIAKPTRTLFFIYADALTIPLSDGDFDVTV